MAIDGQSARRLGHDQSDRRIPLRSWYGTLANGDASRLPSAASMTSASTAPNTLRYFATVGRLKRHVPLFDTFRKLDTLQAYQQALSLP